MPLKTLGLVPARAGSRGLPGKNTRMFCGKPLWLWAYEVAKATCTDAVVSTDDWKILQHPTGRKIARPEHLATDRTPMLDVVRHAIGSVSTDVVVLLQPTSPLRTVEMLQDAISILEADENGEVDSVVSVASVPAKYSPDYVCTEGGAWLEVPAVTRRQDARKAWVRTGDFYVIRRRTIELGSLYGSHCLPFPVEGTVSIDTEQDWEQAEARFMSVNLALGA